MVFFITPFGIMDSNKMQSIPEILLMNAKVITLEHPSPIANWVALGSGRILSLGKTNELSFSETNKTKIIDCDGRTILPGFIDSHLHLLSFAESLVTLDLKPECNLHSIIDIQSKIRKQSKASPGGTWIRGKGYNEFYLKEKRHPNRWDLDEAAPNHPVKLTHRSGHAHVLNSLALKLTGITMETPEPPEGMIDRDLNTGAPTGLLYEMGDFLSARIPPLEDKEIEKGIKLADQELISSGITTIHDASLQNDLKRCKLYSALKEKGVLHPRLNVMIGNRYFSENGLESFLDLSKPDHLTVKGIKIIVDQTTGRLHPSQAELNDIVCKIHESGMQVAVHAIEENAIKSACLAIENALRRMPRLDHRHRIEHCSICPPSLAKRIAKLGIMVVSQPNFIYDSGDRYLETVEEKQMKHLYPFGSLLRSGIQIAGSSDCPFAPLNPFIAISTAISRKTKMGKSVIRGEGVQVIDALKMYTEYGAYSTFAEEIKGSISPGKLADLVVLNEDPLQVYPDEIKDIKVEMTLINGEIVWDAGFN